MGVCSPVVVVVVVVPLVVVVMVESSKAAIVFVGFVEVVISRFSLGFQTKVPPWTRLCLNAMLMVVVVVEEGRVVSRLMVAVTVVVGVL